MCDDGPVRRLDLNDVELPADPARPEGFRRRMARLGDLVGAERTGVTLYELDPGEAVCPYHYEVAEDEWLLVLEGRVTVRTPGGDEELGPMELAFFGGGPEAAHQVRNASDAVARCLMWSNRVWPTMSVYPDSGKVGIWTEDGADDIVVERDAAVGYFHGEAPPAP